jgi:hypothetical protein
MLPTTTTKWVAALSAATSTCPQKKESLITTIAATSATPVCVHYPASTKTQLSTLAWWQGDCNAFSLPILKAHCPPSSTQADKQTGACTRTYARSSLYSLLEPQHWIVLG